MSANKKIKVTINKRDFIVDTELDELQVASLAKFVETRLNEISEHAGSKNPDTSYLTILACLNIADDFIKLQEENTFLRDKVEKKIDDIVSLIDSTLAVPVI